jgi:LysR family hydrogen peroxide-inducible transcriptional activator
MDLRQLAALAAVADHRSFSAAARALHTVQSNVSTHIARLERELEATLVDRSNGQLTDAGELVVARARRIQFELDALVADVASASDHVSGNVRIGVIGTTGRWLVPLLLPAIAEAHPRIAVVVVDATTTSLVPQLLDGRLDLAVVNMPLSEPDIDTEPLFDEDLVLVVPEGHPLDREGPLRIKELGEHPLLLEPPGTAFRDDLDVDAARAGVTLVPQAEVDGMRLLATLAFAGFGPAVLPATAAPHTVTAGAWHRVALEGVTPRSVGLATQRRSLISAPARAVGDVLRRIVAEEGRGHPGVLPAAGSTHRRPPVRSPVVPQDRRPRQEQRLRD